MTHSKPELPQPTFLFIGMSKTGSTWIFEVLNEHPDVFVPHTKDLRFFEDEFYSAEDYERYLQNFRAGRGASAIGELSHNYILSASCAERIRHHLPDVTLLVCLREPGDWAQATYRYTRLFRKEVERGFEHYWQSVLQEQGSLNLYENLQAYYDHFSPDQMHVLFYEDLRRDVTGFLADIYNAVQVDPSFRPSILDKRVNAARSSRFGNRLTQFLNQTAQWLRRHQLESIVGYVKHNALVNRILFSSEVEPVDIPEAAVAAIRADCATHYDDIEALIGRPLPDEWHARAGEAHVG